MRKKLADLNKSRKKFTGIFRRFGAKRNFKGVMEKTVLIESIRDAEKSEILTDHIWFNYTQSFADAGFLKDGDNIEFEARVKLYKKGYINRRAGFDKKEEDYKLSHPTKVKLVVNSD